MLKKEVLKKIIPKWFCWRILPNPENVSFYSLYEIVFYVLIFVFCIIIYNKINTIPYREETIIIESIDKIKWFNLPEEQEGTPIYADIEYYLPMSTNDKLIKDTSNIIVSLTGFYPEELPEQERNFNYKWNFYCDSIREGHKEGFGGYYDPELFKDIELEDNPILMVRNAIFNNKENHNIITRELDSLTKCKWPNFKAYNQFYIEAKQSIVNSLKADLFYKDKEYEEIIGLNDSIIPSELLIHRFVRNYKKDDYIIQKYYETSNLPASMNLCVPDSLGITIGDPGWFALFDISQSYFKININSYSVDQINFKLYFGGAVELSEIYPKPDKIYMNGFEYTNQAKMMYIRENGLLFHVKFKEFQNRQTIRLFFVTAIISSLFMVFIVFIVLGLFLARNAWSKAHKQQNNKQKLLLENLKEKCIHNTEQPQRKE